MSTSSQFSSFSRKISSRRIFAGFTLVELLVAMAILGILSSIVFASVSAARVKSRDARRMKDLDTLQAAVEQFYRDNGYYPVASCAGNANPIVSYDSATYMNNVTCSAAGGAGTQTLAQTLAPYLPTTFKDPQAPFTSDKGYLYKSNGPSQYCIMVWRSPENMNNFPASRINTTRCTSVDSNGQCSPANTNNIYYGIGTYVNGSGC